jgi:hypothetical protein
MTKEYQGDLICKWEGLHNYKSRIALTSVSNFRSMGVTEESYSYYTVWPVMFSTF